ncbi:helicase HerA domain-containing protein [Parerythrobacter jejuensis]|uniref:DUF87 domain-containing protein n=1 Tax=Parerythrobacter jejuensis TaxID=795812 RepID=A0A845AQW0_9SPHN|nr:DUF87 domain-containing protein [Parerythrobacter jejuensis]MXP31573.1 DUF87 domain-containing protein [Parerythrobacter jejuensis]
MKSEITIGHATGDQPVTFDIEELLATRLLVQGNSGSGKSHLLRRLLEESAGMVQQVVIDPEGDFTSLADHFGHVVIDAEAYSPPEIEALARRCREHRASVVLGLEGLEVEQQIRCSAQFLNALFDAPREFWFPALVVVDEAQMFAPSVAGEIAEDTRRMTLSAMTNLMCRGRKRGLAGIVATQRLAKLAKNVAAEASNFLMGRTFLDIDMIRAADLLGMERRQAERIRDLERGHFLALGPAISRRPVAVKIGSVRSGQVTRNDGLMPLPDMPREGMEALLTSELAADVQAHAPAPPPAPPRPKVEEVVPAVEPQAIAARSTAEQAEADATRQMQVNTILEELAMEEGSTFQSSSVQYQNFLTRCRAGRILGVPMDMTEFRRAFAIASAGLERLDEGRRRQLLQLGAGVDDDVLAPYLAIAAAALEGKTAPEDEELARVYGSSSPGRIRRLLDHLEKLGLIVIREEFGGGRSLLVPGIDALSAAEG